MDALKAAWARVRASAGLFAHSAFDDLEAELAKIASAFETRLAAVEVTVGLKEPAAPPPAPSATLPVLSTADAAEIAASLVPLIAQMFGSLKPPAPTTPAA